MTSYPPAVAYQGGQTNQASKNGQTSKLAPATDTQQSGQRAKQDLSSDRNRGKTVDISA
jgi:hypothetical protein